MMYTAPDSTLHYLCCPKLLAVALAALKAPAPHSAPGVLRCLSLSPIHPYQVYVLFIMFTVYHSCKRYTLDHHTSSPSPPLNICDADLKHFTAVALAAARKLEGMLGVSCSSLVRDAAGID